MIDRIRHDIQQRLQLLLAEAEKLRGALAALDPRERSGPTAPARAPRRPATRGHPSSAARPRTAPGATRSTVLAALASGEAMTAGEVATATGLNRGTVSTTLSKCVKTGEVLKAQRGYRLPQRDGAAAAEPGSTVRAGGSVR